MDESQRLSERTQMHVHTQIHTQIYNATYMTSQNRKKQSTVIKVDSGCLYGVGMWGGWVDD